MKTTDQKKLISWYEANQRPLPWRQGRDPYRIWISETMLQQTTTTAVIPYYHRFLKRFPNLKSLASAPTEKVVEAWAGLGYYSRARNLHKAAIALAKMASFPESFEALIELPGFGPYTSRAVSSIAFSEPVGVLDGNVIRVLSRKNDFSVEWWKTQGRGALQGHADAAVQNAPSEIVNQALMELGATVCLPQNPKCIHCPWLKTCEARQQGTIDRLPLSRPKKAKELWVWEPTLFINRNHLFIEKNLYAPFLKNQWLVPGKAKKLGTPPKSYDFRHSITHHAIYARITISQTKTRKNVNSLSPSSDYNYECKWVSLSDIKQHLPTTLVAKALKLLERENGKVKG